jgi:hypothetical protein
VGKRVGGEIFSTLNIDFSMIRMLASLQCSSSKV